MSALYTVLFLTSTLLLEVICASGRMLSKTLDATCRSRRGMCFGEWVTAVGPRASIRVRCFADSPLVANHLWDSYIM